VDADKTTKGGCGAVKAAKKKAADVENTTIRRGKVTLTLQRREIVKKRVIDAQKFLAGWPDGGGRP